MKYVNVTLHSSENEDEHFDGARIHDKKTGSAIFTSTLTNGMYPLPPPRRMQAPASLIGKSPKDQKDFEVVKQWDETLGHVGAKRLWFVPALSIGVPKLNNQEFQYLQCMPCITAAAKRDPLQSTMTVAARPLELTDTDIAGPISTPSVPAKSTRTCSLTTTPASVKPGS